MNKETYIALIISKLNNTISSQDNDLLDNWLKENTENQTIFDETAQVWEDAKAYKTSFKPNKQSAWAKIESQLSENTTTIKEVTKVVEMKKRFPVLKIASALLILLATGFLMKMTIGSNEITNVSTAKNETKNIELPDGSTIILNENSSISYANNFDKRNIKLEGEAFFDVSEDKNSPFSVTTRHTETFVLGTSFNIHAKDGKVDVALITGKIKFVTNKNAVILNPGEKISYNNFNQAIILAKKGTENEIAWNTNKLVFDNTSIIKVLQTLENHFDTTIILTNEKQGDCTFSGTFENSNLEKIIESIAYSFDSKFYFKNELYHIDSLSCTK